MLGVYWLVADLGILGKDLVEPPFDHHNTVAARKKTKYTTVYICIYKIRYNLFVAYIIDEAKLLL